MLVRIYRKLFCIVLGRINPIMYARKIGVNMPISGVNIYGKIYWGTEPWLITIGEGCHITNNVTFETHDGGTLLFRDQIPDLEITKPITLGNNVYVGNNVIFMPGITVGSNVIIGAGAVVTKDIPDNSVAVGVPARVIKSCEEYLEKIKKESLHLGHLHGKEKDRALMKYYKYKGKSKGIYF